MHKELKMVAQKPAKRIKQDIPVAVNEADYNNIMAEIEQLLKAGNGTIRNKEIGRASCRERV